MNNLAPVLLFVYNRPDHTRQTIESLKENKLAEQSELFIYSDACKNTDDKAKVGQVREYIENVDGFKTVTIINRERNLGLAASIIDGVGKTLARYEKVIVLEDDLVTSPYFLKFMNDALEFYKKEDRVWHISGWNYPIDASRLRDVFLWRAMNCWGWATWADNWDFFENNTDKLMRVFSEEEIRKFNLDGVEDFFEQVIANMEGRANTWAIFWYATIFKNGALCVNPSISYVNNIGFDASGVNCGDNYDHKVCKLNHKSDIVFEDAIVENPHAFKLIQEFYKKKRGVFKRVVNKIKLIREGKNDKFV